MEQEGGPWHTGDVCGEVHAYWRGPRFDNTKSVVRERDKAK